MRNFSDEEKEILDAIAIQPTAHDVYTLTSVDTLMAILYKGIDAQVVYFEKNNRGYARIPYTKYHDVRSEFAVFTVQRKTFLFLALLDYLKENNLIYLVPVDSRIYPYQFNPDFSLEGEMGQPYKEANLFEESINDKLFYYIGQSIFPTVELYDYVVNGFKDKEQIRHDDNIRLQLQSIKLAKTLGGISILVALIPILLPEGLIPRLLGYEIVGETLIQYPKPTEVSPPSVADTANTVIVDSAKNVHPPSDMLSKE